MALSLIQGGLKPSEGPSEELSVPTDEEIADRLRRIDPKIDIQERGGVLFVVTLGGDGQQKFTSVVEFFLTAFLARAQIAEGARRHLRVLPR